MFGVYPAILLPRVVRLGMICPICTCTDFYAGPGSRVECPDCGAVIDVRTELLVIEPSISVQQAMSGIGTAS